MKEDQNAKKSRKVVRAKCEAKKSAFPILISCWGLILVGAFLITEIFEAGSFTGFLQRFAQPSMIIFNSILFLSVLGFMAIGYFCQELKNTREQLAQSVEERTQLLRDSQARLKNIFASSPDGITVIDLNGNITECNQATLNMLGYSSKEELIGKSGFRLVAKKDRERIQENLKKLLKQGSIRNSEYTALKKDGNEFQAELSSSVIRDPSGNPTGFVAIIKDITERKKKEKEIRIKDSAVASSINAIALANLDGNLTYVNHSFLELWGYNDDKEVLGKPAAKFWQLEDKVSEVMTALRDKGNWRGELFAKKKDGSAFHAYLSATMVKDEADRPLCMMGSFIDITIRKQMEKKMEEYAERLEELVEERTRELEVAQKQLLKSERLAAIGELAAMIGHDLRNPLTGIATASYYLKKKLAARTDKKTREMMELIEKDIQRSNKIIKDLLDYAKEVRLELTETTPKSIIKEALPLVKIPKNIKVLEATLKKQKIKVDMEKMKRVFVNIIRNAVDAMPKGGELTIESRRSNNSVEITISDTGAGIPEGILEKIWEPLFTTKAKGIGLGLPICKRIVRAHKGTISVKSTVGDGTTFTITIPIKPKIEGGEEIWVKPLES